MSSAHRKVVTVLFCDVVGSTALGESVDPEALQGLLARYFERMKGIVESHGGSVEKFIGDAVMAVFGVPVAHEDDALRACRAAVEMRDALPGLGIGGRIGINTGEVLAGTEERLATGDAVNVAARLEQAAEPGQVLIGEVTQRLVRDAVAAEPVEPLLLKGKAEPVRAHRLVSLLDEPERSHGSRFVGREPEVAQVVEAWERTQAQASCELVTVVGDAGVGKSRLVAEALERIEAHVVRGRCLPYGEGITYWPVVEVVKQLAVLPSDPVAAAAIRSLLGESEVGTGGDEIAWAFRKLLEEQAPLVVCFDDIQWGQDTFLDFLESIALLSTGAPFLLVCMARPELLDRRPGWPATLRLEPLPEEEASELIGEAVPEVVRERIVRAAGGNPLFLTEMVALGNADGGEVEVPPTLRALLAARLDQLDEPERRMLERGAVEGELFHRGSVQALAPEETEVTPRLAALVRRHLVRPDLPQLPREDAYRFRHLLIRDAAYDALPKATRADLHCRLAAWLEIHGNQLVELDEILGYHLEQAARYLAELGRPNPEVALAAGDRLVAAGRRMLWRGDARSAFALLERSLTLTRPHRLDVQCELDLAWAISYEPRTAAAIATAAADRATAAGDESSALLAQAAGASYRLLFGEASAAEVERLARAALPRLQAAGDHHGLITVWRTLADVANFGGRSEDRAKACEEVIRHSRLAGEPPAHLVELAWALVNGPRPAGAALETLDKLVSEQFDPRLTMQRALLMAMLDRVDEARALAAPAQERMRDFGYAEEANFELAEIAVLAGDQELAAVHYRSYCDFLEAGGRQAELSTYAPRLGQLLCSLGRYEEAAVLAEQGRVLGDPDDVATQAGWRLTQALVCSERGQHAEAERLVREALATAETTDNLQIQAAALSELGEVLGAAGRRDEAATAWQEALDRYERKEIVPLARHMRERLAAFRVR